MNKSIKILINYIFGPVLFVILSISIYHQIIQQPDLLLRWQQIKKSWQDPFFIFAILLVFVNWGVEAIKWKKLINPLEKITLLTAYKSVLAGSSITLLTPNRIGEYGGRILFLKNNNRTSAISISILGGISQLMITLIAGCFGIVFLTTHQIPMDLAKYVNPLILIISSITAIILLILFFYHRSFINLIEGYGKIGKIKNHLSMLYLYNRKELLRILFFSFFRYLIFILQYLLLLKVMKVEINTMTSMSLISIFYLLMAIAPTIGMIELPVRATLSLLILGVYSNNTLGIQAATFIIWIINIVVPAIIGSVFVIKNKLYNDEFY